MIRSKGLPGVSLDVEVFKGSFKSVFVALLLATNGALPVSEIPIEDLLG